MKKLVATAPRTAELVEYEDREIKANEVKVKVEFAAPKHGTELADFRGRMACFCRERQGRTQRD